MSYVRLSNVGLNVHLIYTITICILQIAFERTRRASSVIILAGHSIGEVEPEPERPIKHHHFPGTDIFGRTPHHKWHPQKDPPGMQAGSRQVVQVASLADNLSYSMIPKPFKDEKTKKGPRRNKPLKQILANERLRAKQVSDLLSKNNPSVDDDVDMATAPDDQSNTTDQPHQSQSQPVAVNKKARREILGTINPEVNYNTYLVIEAPPSVIPPKKYCDITGLEAPYVDPKTRLRYHNAEVYELIRTFGPGLDQSYLSLRGAHITLR
ncbi:hypothetical protein H4Q26_018207 [Puccinia striiformis f. sp. tritici PST-130]|nr:hypothetical protein H4Q26_018207 [Puccinia striiformis f. sp. tritici PST-130]